MSRTVVVKSASGLRQTVIIGSHHFLADEAKDVGGTDEGPDPYQYQLAALGTCTDRRFARMRIANDGPCAEYGPPCLTRKATLLTASIANSQPRWSTALRCKSHFWASCRKNNAIGCCKSRIDARYIER